MPSCAERASNNLAAADISTRGVGFPALQNIPEQHLFDRNTSGIYNRKGSDYFMFKSEKANASFTNMILPGVTQLDWAMYRFGEFPVTDSLVKLSLKTIDKSDYWVGLSNYKTNGWSWVECKDQDNLEIDLTKYNSLVSRVYVFYVLVVAKSEKVEIVNTSITTTSGTSSSKQGIYPMMGGSQFRRGCIRAVGPASAPKLKWTPFPTSSSITAAPVIDANNTVYVGSSNNTLWAINPDGNKKWHYNTSGSVDSSPAIDSDGTVYFACYDQYVRALDAEGNYKWQYKMIGQGYSSPCIYKDRVYVGAHGSQSIYALNKADGSLIWFDQLAGMLTTRYCSPAVDSSGNVYINSSGRFYSIQMDKTINWVLDEVASGTSYGSSDYTPVIGETGILYFYGTYKTNAVLWAVYPNSVIQWQLPLKNLGTNSVSIAPDGTICFVAWVTSLGKLVLYMINPDSSTKYQVEIDVPSDKYQNPSNIIIDQAGSMYFTSSPDRVYAYSSNGKQMWTYDVGDGVESLSPPGLDSNGTLYVGTGKGTLLALTDN